MLEASMATHGVTYARGAQSLTSGESRSESSSVFQKKNLKRVKVRKRGANQEGVRGLMSSESRR